MPRSLNYEDIKNNHPRKRFICSKCGGDDVGWDGTVRWDELNQSETMGSAYDDTWCHECGEQDLIEVPIPADEALVVPAADPTGYTLRDMEAAMILWEAFLDPDEVTGTVQQLHLQRERIGTIQMRHNLMALVPYLQAIWRAIRDEPATAALEPFDWAFAGHFLMACTLPADMADEPVPTPPTADQMRAVAKACQAREPQLSEGV